MTTFAYSQIFTPTIAQPFGGFVASQKLMDILLSHNFVECEAIGGFRSMGRYISGRTYYFRRNGDCTICFLKDGRVHVLQGPHRTWQLCDVVEAEYMRVLLAFCTLDRDEQTFFRNFMAKHCKDYTQIVQSLPRFEVEWKESFKNAYSALLLDGVV